MKRLKWAVALSVMALVVSATVFVGLRVTHASEPHAGCTWTTIASPDPGTANVFDGVAALSASDIWAVGYADTQTLTAHWDGSSWSLVPSANPSSQSFLFAVTVLSDTNVWAVGQNGSQVLTEEWNGTDWNVVSSPTPGASSNFVGVAKVPGTSHVWAVGNYQPTGGGPDQTLIEYWNESQWSLVPSPNAPGQGSDLLGIVALSQNNAWAVGTYADTAGVNHTLTEHWNGRTWSIVPSADVEDNGVLWAVTAIPDSARLWAVGTYQNTSGVNLTLTEQWTGSTWNVVSSPNVEPAGENSTLFAVTALSNSDVWAAGLAYDNSGLNQGLIVHWNGHQWSIVASPNVGGDSTLTGITRAPESSQVWAVGVSGAFGSGQQTVTEFCGQG